MQGLPINTTSSPKGALAKMCMVFWGISMVSFLAAISYTDREYSRVALASYSITTIDTLPSAHRNFTVSNQGPVMKSSSLVFSSYKYRRLRNLLV